MTGTTTTATSAPRTRPSWAAGRADLHGRTVLVVGAVVALSAAATRSSTP